MAEPSSPAELRRLLLERFPVFRELPAPRLEQLLAQAQLVRVPAGGVLFDSAQPCRGFPLVLEGAVRVAKLAPNGREILLYRVEPGQGCILSGGCLLGHSDYSARGVAERDVTLLSLPPTPFHELMLGFEPFRRFVFGMYGERLAEVMEPRNQRNLTVPELRLRPERPVHRNQSPRQNRNKCA